MLRRVRVIRRKTHGFSLLVAAFLTLNSGSSLIDSLRCSIIRCMRTTLDIDDDVLQAAKELARRERKTAGRILSELARRGLTQPENPYAKKGANEEGFLGFRPFTSRGRIVTNEMIDRLRQENVD
jgi:hypothetical protein